MDASLKAKFDKAAKAVKESKGPKSTNDVLLEIYSYFKQATEGDCKIEKPGMFKMEAKAKYDAWMSRKGMSKEDAMKKYIELAEKHVPGFKA